MKQLVIIAVLLCCLGCRTKRAVTETVKVDTTHTTLDSVAIGDKIIDTTKTETAGNNRAIIEFVDTGGIIKIDSKGNITIQGVKHYDYSHTYKDKQEKGITVETDSSRVSASRDNGLYEKNHWEEPAKNTASRIKWYDTVFISIGCLCCIAALLYLLFLYLKKKL